MEKEICSNCKTKPVYVKKRTLCHSCYQKDRLERIKNKEYVVGAHEDPVIVWEREVEFVKNFFAHKNWMFHPAIFKFNGTRYEPDFYDGKTNTFIEVGGTRQAFEANLEKYRNFIKAFPKIKFEVRHTNGELIDIRTKKQKWPAPLLPNKGVKI